MTRKQNLTKPKHSPSRLWERLAVPCDQILLIDVILPICSHHQKQDVMKRQWRIGSSIKLPLTPPYARPPFVRPYYWTCVLSAPSINKPHPHTRTFYALTQNQTANWWEGGWGGLSSFSMEINIQVRICVCVRSELDWSWVQQQLPVLDLSASPITPYVSGKGLCSTGRLQLDNHSL